jgi:hypothetical protein
VAIGFRDFRRRTLAPNATNPVPNNSIEVGSGVTNPAVVNGVAPSVPLRHGCDDTTGQVKAVMSSPATFPSRLVRESRLSPQAVGVQLHQMNREIRKPATAGTVILETAPPCALCTLVAQSSAAPLSLSDNFFLRLPTTELGSDSQQSRTEENHRCWLRSWGWSSTGCIKAG